MQQSLVQHRKAITKAYEMLRGKSLHMELALLGDSEQQKERMKQEVRDACNELILATQALMNEYCLDSPLVLVEEQLI